MRGCEVSRAKPTGVADLTLCAGASKAEEEANQKRWKESGGGVGPMDQW